MHPSYRHYGGLHALLETFLEALTSGFINGDELRRRGAIRPYMSASINSVTGLALRDRRANGGLDRSENSNEQAVETISDSEGSSDLITQIAHTSRLQDTGRITLDVEDMA